MAQISKRDKALSVSPLKTSQTVGASLAFLGINRAMPMMHGSQGCTAFGKVFFVRHFREPVPLQTTAMDQVSSVMGADDNVVEGLRAIADKAKPALIGVPTTGLAETQGCDVQLAVKKFRSSYPQYDHIKVVAVNTPDFSGCFETGFAAAVHAMIASLVPEAAAAGTRPGSRRKQINVLAGSLLGPGDVEALKELIESFGLRPLLLPDLGDSLDGHLGDDAFSPVSTGGTPVAELATLGDALATVVIGPSLYAAADLLAQRTGVPVHRLPHLMSMSTVDALVCLLAELAQCPVPDKLERQRAQLQDAMLDTHFMLGMARFAIAQDADGLRAWSDLAADMGAETVAAVVPSRGVEMEEMRVPTVKIGDLEDLERMAAAAGAELVIGNSHAVATAERLRLPILRFGFPLYDLIGGYQTCRIGYKGVRQTLFDLANMMLAADHRRVEPYISSLAQKPEYQKEQKHESGTAYASLG